MTETVNLCYKICLVQSCGGCAVKEHVFGGLLTGFNVCRFTCVGKAFIAPIFIQKYEQNVKCNYTHKYYIALRAYLNGKLKYVGIINQRIYQSRMRSGRISSHSSSDSGLKISTPTPALTSLRLRPNKSNSILKITI